MCYLVYLGSDMTLPTTRAEDATGFYLSEPGREIDDIRHHFSTTHVYYAGSHAGCGCGFFYDDWDEREELGKASVRGLVEMIRRALRTTSKSELLVTWDYHSTWAFRGWRFATRTRAEAPLRRLSMRPEELLADRFPLAENDFVTFRPRAEVAQP